MTAGLSFVAGVAGATLTIFVTALDECSFLVPLVAQATSPHVALVRGLVFVVTMLSLSVAVCLAAVLLRTEMSRRGKSKNDEDDEASEIITKVTGAVVCWILAGYYYYKVRAARRAGAASEDADSEHDSDMFTPINRPDDAQISEDTLSHIVGTVNSSDMLILVATNSNELATPLLLPDESSDDPLHSNERAVQPWTIITLTIAGSLDEMSYFSGLIIANVFNPVQLCIGTLLASLLVLVMIDTLVKKCGGCIRVLNRIPIYAIVGLFALFLTIDLVWDLVHS
ncbi:hypothetical protein MPSEU_000134100 [Mayamaea pseudoterrestris]|nr:hypothetical protein MPSEU_000134100 [Mayamaea pseudoterrestris]